MKTEKEKMLAGEIYNCGDKELSDRWHIAKDLIRELNTNTNSRDVEKQNNIYSSLFGSKGDNLVIVAPFFCDYGENISIGNNTEINHNCVFLDCNKITIGDNVLIAPSVQLYTVYHPISVSERISVNNPNHKGMAFCSCVSKPITIGNNVWIGGGSIVLPGVTIGENSVIGAGSVVTRNIPSNVLAVGNPCRVVREID